jgi:hypothetical protein
MATKQFDTLLNEYLSQLTEAPVAFVGSEDEATKDLGKNAIKYIIDTISKTLNISTEEVWKKMQDYGFYKELFPGGVNAANDEATFRRSIANVLKKILPKFEKEFKGVKGDNPLYTARVTSTAGEKGGYFKKEYDKRAKIAKPEGTKAAPVTKETTAQERFGKDLDKDMQRIWDRVNASGGVSEQELNEIARSSSVTPEDGDFNKKILMRQGYLVREGDKIVAKDPKEITSDDSDVPALDAPYEGDFDIERDAPEIADIMKEFDRERTYSQDN